METQTVIVIVAGVASIIAVYHTVVVSPKSKRDELFFKRIRELEQSQIKMKTKLDGLHDLPNAITDLKDTINDLKVEIARK